GMWRGAGAVMSGPLSAFERSGNRFAERKRAQLDNLERFPDSMKRGEALEHFRAKWTPVRVKKMR
ncbi:hypothetical protein, partial [Xanthobacter autotrophicus]|uniref:hypothetical protein n=1 Tax=Xanthobacter autotrophicus TaxID=280 RepID=UPI0024A76488